MIYIVDANVLITANDSYYSIGMVPEFWHWLEEMALQGQIQMPQEVFDEVQAGKKDPLTTWIKEHKIEDIICLPETIDAKILRQVMTLGYAPDLNDIELVKIGQDPFLVAYAAMNPSDRVVVSNEVSSPSKIRANRKVPDVCASMGVRCITPIKMLRELTFSTNWKHKPSAASSLHTGSQI